MQKLPGSRNTAYAPLTPIRSEDLNALQDLAVDRCSRTPTYVGETSITDCPDAVTFDPKTSAFVFAHTNLHTNKLHYMWGNWGGGSGFAPSPIGTVGSNSGGSSAVRLRSNGLGTLLAMRPTGGASATHRLNQSADSYTLSNVTLPNSSASMPLAIWNVDRWIGKLASTGAFWYGSPDGVTWTAIADPSVGTFSGSGKPANAEPAWAVGENGRLVILHGEGGATNVGAYTDNRGLSWIAIPSAPNFALDMVYLPLQKALVASLYNAGFLACVRSLDNGATWTAVNGIWRGQPVGNGLAYGDGTNSLKHMTALGPGTLVASLSVDTALTGGGITASTAFLVMSHDAGTSWSAVARIPGGDCDEIATGGGAIVVRNKTTEKAYWFAA